MLTPPDHIEIREVLADYGHVVDDHDWDRAEDVFTPDVVFESNNGEMGAHRGGVAARAPQRGDSPAQVLRLSAPGPQ